MTVITNTEKNNSYVNISSGQHGTSGANGIHVECVLSNTLQTFVKFYRSNISLQERRQLTVAASKGRLDYKTSTVIREQEEEMLNILELPVSNL